MIVLADSFFSAMPVAGLPSLSSLKSEHAPGERLRAVFSRIEAVDFSVGLEV